ncbi:glycosyltransferase family 9 protein [Krasilnikovia sp. M28-CT-15]|uniref:glycosyltransferase family 9 protein n=1 Tax=Krasilnikovia sp. M28-CT-15 TaxID=3373540 RepID=UPI0038771159
MILALCAPGVGDLATAVPALRAVRAAFVARTLALAAPAWLVPLAELVGGIDRVLPAAGLAPNRWTTPGPEVAVNLHGCGPESHRLLSAVRPAKLWAFANAEAAHLDGPDWDEDEHETQRWCRLLGYYGVAADAADLALAVPQTPAPHGVTIVHPGAKAPGRRWPPDRFAAVARVLATSGHHVVVTGSADETDLSVRVARGAGLPAAAVLAGRTGLATLAALVAHARLVISGDTGIAHLATAYRVPSVVLFGPVPPRRWGPPPGRAYHRAIWHGGLGQRGATGPAAHPALLAVRPEEVLAAAAEAEHARHPSRRRDVHTPV